MIHLKKIDKKNFSNTYGIHVGSEQTQFINSDLEGFVKNWQGDSQLDCFLVFKGEDVVGFFALDFSSERHAYIDSSSTFCMLRNFIIDYRFQGTGLSAPILETIYQYMGKQYSQVKRLLLTVNFENPRAIQVYKKAGFHKLSEPYLGGVAGPQHIMEKRL